MQDNIFTVKDLSFAYGKQKVLDDLALTLHEGTITTLIGANGCGKSTLFNLMTKNLKPDSGEIFLRDKNIADLKLKEFAREAAIVHQYNTAPIDISVEKLVSYGRTPYHTMRAFSECKKRRRKSQLGNGNNRYIETQTQGGIPAIRRTKNSDVWIAMALAQDTKILFLDEPTTYLDIRYQLQILKLIRQLNQEYNLTIVMVLHDINQSLYYSDEIIAMKDGKIIAQGLPEDIITPELVKSVFDVELNISTENGKPFILPI
ncbi:MAG: ABC transporter ATP-binding protein [Eubacteriales bacterium]